MPERTNELRKYDGARLRGSREANELLKNLGLIAAEFMREVVYH